MSEKNLRWPIVVLVLIAWLHAGEAEAKPDYLKRYEAGLQAIEREDWSRASDLMQKALQERANEAGRLSQWFFWDPYVPHYYYGVARFHLDDCGQALRSFNSSEEQGVLIDEEDLYPTLLDLREKCEARGVREAQAGPGDDTEKRVRVGDLAQSASTVVDAASPLAKSEKDKQRFRDVQTGLTTVQATDKEAERISEMADGSAPRELDRAINALFGGDARQALALLEAYEVDADDKKAKAHVNLLRAAAAHRLFLLSAEQDQGLGERARQYAQAFKAAGAGVAPPQSLFGPRFLEFLASVGL